MGVDDLCHHHLQLHFIYILNKAAPEYCLNIMKAGYKTVG